MFLQNAMLLQIATRLHWRRPLLASVFLVLVPLSGCGPLFRATRDFSLTAAWQNFERIYVRTVNGSVELTSEPGEGIRIIGTKTAGGMTWEEAEDNVDQIEITAAADPNDAATFIVRAEVPEHLLSRNSPGAKFVIRLPQPAGADIHTGNGSVTVRRLKGDVQVHTSNGRIIAEHIDGRLEARTSNGSVRVEHVQRGLKVHTCNGDVRASVVRGDCEIETSNGCVEAFDLADGHVQVTSANGRLRVEARPPDDARVMLETSNSAVHASLPATLKGELSLRTSNGRLVTNMGNATFSRPRWSRHSFEAVMNGGGSGRVLVQTSNGTITFDCH